MRRGGGQGGVIALMVVVELGGSHLVEWYKMSYYSSTDYSDFLGPKSKVFWQNTNVF